MRGHFRLIEHLLHCARSAFTTRPRRPNTGVLMATLTRAVALGLILAASPARAQMTTGSISGRVNDAQGAAVPGVTIEARNTGTGFVRIDVTSQTGSYHLS